MPKIDRHLAVIENSTETTVNPGDAANQAVRVNVVAGGGSGGTSHTDDTAFTPGASSVTPIGAMLDDTAPDSVDEGDVGVVRMTATRALHVSVRDGAGDSAMDDANDALRVNVVAGGTSGTQYTEGDTDTTITGTAVMFESDTGTSALAVVNASTPLPTVQTGALPAGTNNIGDVDVLTLPALPAGTNNIGDVDVLSVVPGTGATNLGKAEDAAHTSGDVGVMALAVRSDAGGAIAGTDGDYTPLQVDSAGALRVTGGGGGTQYTEGDTDTTITGTAILWEDAGDALATVSAASPLPVGDAGGSLTVDVGTALPSGTNNIGDVDVLSVVPGTGATNLGKAEDAAHTTGDTGVMALAVRNDTPGSLAGTDGDYAPLQLDSSGNARVALGAALPAGTNNIGDVDVLSGPTGASAIQVQGTVAHDGADAQNPVGLGARAIAHGTNPTAVAAADRTVLYANRAGVLFTIGGHPNTLTLRANYTAAQTDTAIVTVSAGTKIAVTRVTVTADHANTVDVAVRIGFAATNTPTTTGVLAAHPGIEAGGGFTIGDGSGILGVGADGEDLRITSEVPTSGSIDICVSYFTIES